MARIGFVGNFFLDKVKWLIGTGEKIIETGSQLSMEMNQRHEDIGTFDTQQKAKKELKSALALSQPISHTACTYHGSRPSAMICLRWAQTFRASSSG